MQKKKTQVCGKRGVNGPTKENFYMQVRTHYEQSKEKGRRAMQFVSSSCDIASLLPIWCFTLSECIILTGYLANG